MDIKNNEKSLLTDFLQKFEQIPTDLLETLLKVTEDEDEKNVINSFAPAFKSQFRELSVVASGKAAIATRQGLSEVEQFLKVSSGTALASNMKLALPSIGSLVGKLGLAGIVQEIKKILKKVLEILHITLPEWVEAALLIIDEILNLLLGGGSVKTRTALSQLEQNYLAEKTHLAKLERASEFRYQQDSDDE